MYEIMVVNNLWSSSTILIRTVLTIILVKEEILQDECIQNNGICSIYLYLSENSQ